MKPILFNTEMVRALLDGRKTVTRRAVKESALERFVIDDNGELIGSLYPNDKECIVYPSVDDCPYQPGDILYVRETWAAWSPTYGTAPEIIYKADGYSQSHKMKWRPSIHMPREAARLFLRVKDVRVERLHDMTTADMVDEGMDAQDARHSPWKWHALWDSTIKPADRALYGWAANPWVWVIEFERITKEVAEDG